MVVTEQIRRVRRDPVPAVLVGLVLAPMVAGLVVLALTSWHPFLDSAVHELRIRDVGTANNPLTGPAATVDGIQGEANHPGPLAFYVLAIPYRLLGGGSKAVPLGAALVNMAALVGVLLVARRRGGNALMALTSVFVALLVHGLGLGLLFDEWNPWIALVPFALLLLLVWSVACGDLAVLPVAVFVWSFTTQAHLGLAYYSAALALWTIVATVLAVRRRSRAAPPGERARARRRASVPVAVAVGVGLLCWAPPLVNQFTNEHGNLSRLVDIATTPRAVPATGSATAVQVVADQLGGVAPFFVGRGTEALLVEPASPLLLLVPGAALAAAMVLAWRRNDADTLRLHVTVLVVALASVPTIAAVTGPLYVHYVRALWSLGAVLWLSVAWSVWQWATDDADRRAAATRWLMIGSMVVVGAVGTLTVIDRRQPLLPNEVAQRIAAVGEDAAPSVFTRVSPNPVLVEDDGTLDGAIISSALQLELEKRGVPTLVNPSYQNEATFGIPRAANTPGARLWVGTGDNIARPKTGNYQPVYSATVGNEPVTVFVEV